MPGHFLQLACSNEFRAPTLVRAIFQSGPFIEGWAVYCEQVMAERGYGGPEVKMQQLKMRLRATCNAILDQSIHAGNMSEKEAMDLMTKEGTSRRAKRWRNGNAPGLLPHNYPPTSSAPRSTSICALPSRKNSRPVQSQKIQRPGNLLRQPTREIRTRIDGLVIL